MNPSLSQLNAVYTHYIQPFYDSSHHHPPTHAYYVPQLVTPIAFLTKPLYFSSPQSEIHTPSYCIFLDLKHFCSI
jgi:hypothetical protein